MARVTRGTVQRLTLTTGLVINFYGTVTSGTYILDASAPFAYAINAMNGIQTSAGTLTAVIQIGGVSVTGLDNMGVTAVAQNFTATANNNVAVGNEVTLIISNTVAPTNLSGTLSIAG